MEDVAPYTNWVRTESLIMGIAGVTWAEPSGELTPRDGCVVIGTLRILRGGVRALPRRGLTATQERKLWSAAMWAALTGPCDSRWIRERGTGWVAEIFVRQVSGERSASARAICQLSVPAVPLTQSSSGCTG